MYYDMHVNIFEADELRMIQVDENDLPEVGSWDAFPDVYFEMDQSDTSSYDGIEMDFGHEVASTSRGMNTAIGKNSTVVNGGRSPGQEVAGKGKMDTASSSSIGGTKKTSGKKPRTLLYQLNAEDYRDDQAMQFKILRAKQSERYRSLVKSKVDSLTAENAELREEIEKLKESHPVAENAWLKQELTKYKKSHALLKKEVEKLQKQKQISNHSVPCICASIYFDTVPSSGFS